MCCCGGTIYTYIWDGTDAILAQGYFTTNEWFFDADGFHTQATLYALEQVNNWRRKFTSDNKFYKSKAECIADNKPKVVRF